MSALEARTRNKQAWGSSLGMPATVVWVVCCMLGTVCFVLVQDSMHEFAAHNFRRFSCMVVLGFSVGRTVRCRNKKIVLL